MSFPQGRRDRRTYRNRERWHFPREEGEGGTDYEVVNEPLPLHYSHHYYQRYYQHHHPTTTIHEAMETQSAASYSSSSLPSSSSSSPFPTRPSRCNHRSAAVVAAGSGRRILPTGAPTPSSSSSSLASPALDYSASAPASASASASFSSSPSSSSPLLVQTADIPNTNMATLALTRRSHQQPSYRGRRRLAAGTTPRPRVSLPPKESPRSRQASQQLQQQQQQQPSSQPLPWWKSWESVAIYLDNVPLEANTYTLWRAFKDQGDIFSIDLYEDVHGNREAKGKIRFK